jgi:hypothetical protein
VKFLLLVLKFIFTIVDMMTSHDAYHGFNS